MSLMKEFEVKINKLLQNTSKEILKASTALQKAKKSLDSIKIFVAFENFECLQFLCSSA